MGHKGTAGKGYTGRPHALFQAQDRMKAEDLESELGARSVPVYLGGSLPKPVPQAVWVTHFEDSCTR